MTEIWETLNGSGSGSGGSSTRPSLPHGRTTTSAALP